MQRQGTRTFVDARRSAGVPPVVFERSPRDGGNTQNAGLRDKSMGTQRARRFGAVFVLALLLLAPVAYPQAPGNPPPYYAIKGARIVPVSGPAIENGTVVIANGLITAVGKDVPIPPEAWVIDGKGLTVYPGLIDALTDLGMPSAPTGAAAAGQPGAGPPGAVPQAAQQAGARPSQGPEDRPGTTPWRNPADELSPSDRRIEQWRNAGFTSTMSVPRTGIFPGQGAVINLAGERSSAMVVRSSAALGLTLQAPGGFAGFPGSLMGTVSYIKQLFLDADHARQAQTIYDAKPRGAERPEYDRSTAVLNHALRDGKPVLIPGNTPAQIVRALALGDEINKTQQNKPKWILYGAQQGFDAADLIAKRGVPVIVSLRWPEKERDADPEAEDSLFTLRLREKAPSTPAALDNAGVKFAFYSDGIAAPRDILRNAKKSIDAGLKSDAALRAFTLGAAEILGVADRLGSIEQGKIANLVVADGDIFNERTRLKMVFVDGRKYTVPELPAQPEARPGGAPGAGPAANMTGRWNINVITPDGVQQATADLTQSATAQLTGSLNTMFGNSSVAGGSLTGNRFLFKFMLDIGQGPVEFTMSGTVEGNTFRGTVSFGDGSFECTGTKSGPGAQQITEEVGR